MKTCNINPRCVYFNPIKCKCVSYHTCGTGSNTGHTFKLNTSVFKDNKKFIIREK